jgi:hypothetical protein
MKARNCISRKLPAVLLPVALAGSLTLFAAPTQRPAQPEAAKPAEMPKSTFVIPNSPKEGRDPFFPQSNRLFSKNSGGGATNSPSSMAINSLSLKSIVAGLAIINNHSFAPGEAGDVVAPDGRRQHIRLVEINSNNTSVIVEIGGRNIELTLHAGL